MTPVLTVLVPVYNERATIAEVLDRVSRATYSKQLVVIDDGSRDGTSEVIAEWLKRADFGSGLEVDVLRHAVNRGKGAAIRTGLARARGAVTLVQDADLEYDVADYPALVAPILAGEAEVVYGSRRLRGDNPPSPLPNRLCVTVLNQLVRVLYGLKLTDEATCYKAIRTDLLRRMDLRCERFEFCPEVTAKLGLMGVRILEVPVRYRPRGSLEGKKIRWTDGVEAVMTLLRWRFAPFQPGPDIQESSATGTAIEVPARS